MPLSGGHSCHGTVDRRTSRTPQRRCHRHLDRRRPRRRRVLPLPPVRRDRAGAHVDVVASMDDAPLSKLRTVLSAAAGPNGAGPMIDVDPEQRLADARRLAAMVPAILARLHRRAIGEALVDPDPSLGHAAAYLHDVTGAVPRPEHARALEQYLILTVDHGFNASTFTGRVVASTGAGIVDVVCAAMGALAGPLHGGGPRRGPPPPPAPGK